MSKSLLKEVNQHFPSKEKNISKKQTSSGQDKEANLDEMFEEKFKINSNKKIEKPQNSLKKQAIVSKPNLIQKKKANNSSRVSENSSEERKRSDNEILDKYNKHYFYNSESLKLKEEHLPISVKNLQKSSEYIESKTKTSNAVSNNVIFTKNMKSGDTILHKKPTLIHNKSEETVKYELAEKVQNYNCGLGLSDQGQKFEELIIYIKSKQIQIIPIKNVKNEGVILGEGGFGVVYSGEWGGSQVAIKEMFISYEEFKVMDSELNFMGHFRNPRLVTLYGIYLQEIRSNKLQCGFVMELMKKDLETYLYNDQNADKSFKKKIKITIEVMKAIHYLHSNGVVHRDIKPKNILLNENDEAKLADLGIAKVLENKEKTESATIAFTARYASREAAIESITSLSNDIWSFGILMYEILTEKKPWGNLNNIKILVFLNNMEDPFQKDWDKELDSELVTIIKICSNYDYLERASSEKVLKDLLEYEKKKFK